MYFFRVPAPLLWNDGSGHRALTLEHIVQEMLLLTEH